MVQATQKQRTFDTHCYCDWNGEAFQIWRIPGLWDFCSDLPVESVELNSLISEIDRTRWFSPTQPPTIRRVVGHCLKMQRADLSFPILLGPKGQVIDGCHRLAKALLEGHKSIKAIRLNALPPADIVTDTAEEGMELLQNEWNNLSTNNQPSTPPH